MLHNLKKCKQCAKKYHKDTLRLGVCLECRTKNPTTKESAENQSEALKIKAETYFNKEIK